MKIVVLEKVAVSQDQINRLEKLGKVDWYDSSTNEECQLRIKEADVVVIDWIDPSPFVLSMKSPSLLALMSTGYSWIQHREEAKEKGVIISNIPNYATEAVAEHLIGLAFCIARYTMIGDRGIRSGKQEKGSVQGIELRGRQMGIIGLGNIGYRVAEISRSLGMNIVTYNRNKKLSDIAKDVSLKELLATSDVVCICCPLNRESKDMLNSKNLNILKPDAILLGATWDIVVLDDLISILKQGNIRGAGFDVAIEGGKIDLPKEFYELQNVVLTPHIGYNTKEAIIRQADICISNIEAFKKGIPFNIVN